MHLKLPIISPGTFGFLSVRHMFRWCFLWNMILSVLQCFCGGETALYAHASRQASGHQNRSAVHKQSQVRWRLWSHLRNKHAFDASHPKPQFEFVLFVFQVTGQVSWTQLSAENQSLHWQVSLFCLCMLGSCHVPSVDETLHCLTLYFSGNLETWLQFEGEILRALSVSRWISLDLFLEQTLTVCCSRTVLGQGSLISSAPTQKSWTWKNPTMAACQQSLNTWWVIEAKLLPAAVMKSSDKNLLWSTDFLFVTDPERTEVWKWWPDKQWCKWCF